MPLICYRWNRGDYVERGSFRSVTCADLPVLTGVVYARCWRRLLSQEVAGVADMFASFVAMVLISSTVIGVSLWSFATVCSCIPANRLRKDSEIEACR